VIVIRASRSRLWYVFGLTLLMVGTGAYMTSTPDKLLRIVGIIWIAFFGIALVAIPVKALGSRLTLVLDREGLITLPTRVPVHRVPWDQVTQVLVWSLSGQKFVGIGIRDRSVLGDTAVSKFIRDADMAVSGCAINIPDTMIDRSAQEMVDLLRRYCASPEERAGLGVWDPRSPARR